MESSEMNYLLAEGELSVLISLAEELLAEAKVKVIQEPATCLVMMQAVESVQGRPFNLGEVLITECAVEIEGVRSKGYALGDEPERALCAALLKAAVLGGHPLAQKIKSLLAGEKEAVRQRELAEFGLVGRTRVDFEVMNP